METYSYSNIIILHCGCDHMSKVSPVVERDWKLAYELPMGCHERRVMLKKSWKLEPPTKSNQHTVNSLLVPRLRSYLGER
jgi:hypothetical protein